MSQTIQGLRSQRGVSLTELAVTMALFGMIMVGVMGVWLKTQGEEKIFLHGLIQIAAAFHHRARRNSGGFRSLLEKGLNKLERLDGGREGIDLEALCGQLERWRDFLNHKGSSSEHPPVPRILMR